MIEEAQNPTTPSPLESQDNINTIITSGDYAGLPMVLHLLMTNTDWHSILVADDYKLANLIRSESLNYIIKQYDVGISPVILLSCHDEGIAILAANDYKLTRLITADSLNNIIQQGIYAGMSAVFYLSSNENGLELLAANDFGLASLITADTLNYVIPQGICTGMSVALYLSSQKDGRAILAAHNYKLAKLIIANSLNNVVQQDNNYAESIAFCLAANEDGLEILAANNYELAKLLTEKILNTAVAQNGKPDISIRILLETTEDGRAILMHNAKAQIIRNKAQKTIAHAWRKHAPALVKRRNAVSELTFKFKGQEYSTTCPISIDVMKRPTILTTSKESITFKHVFEHKNIIAWLNLAKRNPLNNIECDARNLQDFPDLKDFIKQNLASCNVTETRKDAASTEDRSRKKLKSC